VRTSAEELGLSVEHIVDQGSPVEKGDVVARFSGNPKQIALAEERLIGLMAKASGIATAARRFVERAGPDIQIVSGAWKKVHPSQKEIVRRAVAVGGAMRRICEDPFVYLDKNYVKMLGGIEKSLRTVGRLNGYVKVIQITGSLMEIEGEANQAVENGANIVFIDNGNPYDVEKVSRYLRQKGRRNSVKLAFAGSIRLEDLDTLKTSDVDILDIGRSVIDAPLLDMRMRVVSTFPGGIP
ncbi:MAG: hypothetical protein GY866_41595, partial [Proteobacteria bacterium]|nr:hypothetical protein [Pseudomonadota bacterium]